MDWTWAPPMRGVHMDTLWTVFSANDKNVPRLCSYLHWEMRFLPSKLLDPMMCTSESSGQTGDRSEVYTLGIPRSCAHPVALYPPYGASGHL